MGSFIVEAEKFNAFNGYHVIGRVDWNEQDLAPHGQYAPNFRMTEREMEKMHILRPGQERVLP